MYLVVDALAVDIDAVLEVYVRTCVRAYVCMCVCVPAYMYICVSACKNLEIVGCRCRQPPHVVMGGEETPEGGLAPDVMQILLAQHIELDVLAPERVDHEPGRHVDQHLCMCTCVVVYECMNVCTHVIHVCVCVYVCIYVHVCVHTCVRCVFVFVPVVGVCLCI